MSNAHKPTVKKVSSMLRIIAMSIAAAVTIGIMSLIATIAVNSGDDSDKVKTANAAAKEIAAEEAINWKKASVDEYELVDKAVKITTTKKVTANTENNKTEKKTTKNTKPSVEAVDSKIMYAKEPVNMRVNPDLNAEVIVILGGDEEVTVNGKTADGWYRVSYADYTGYCKSEYFTDSAPVNQQTVAVKKTTEAETIKAEPVMQTNSYSVSCSDEEFEMFCYVLQNEVGYMSDDSKIAVANVILNRVKSQGFPNTLKGVLTANNQFTAISNYYNKTNAPTQSTIDCARRALNGEDNSNGAIFYYAPKYCGGSTASWFESLTFCMEFEGQRFFKY